MPLATQAISVLSSILKVARSLKAIKAQLWVLRLKTKNLVGEIDLSILLVPLLLWKYIAYAKVPLFYSSHGSATIIEWLRLQ